MAVLSSYLANFLIYTILVISLNNFVLAKTSIWSVGHIAFWGAGAFLTGWFMHQRHLDPIVSALASVLLVTDLGILVAVIAVKLRNDYFVILSLVLVEIVRVITLQVGGPDGYNNLKRPALLGIPLANDWVFILVILVPSFAMATFFADRSKHRPIERISQFVRQDMEVANLFGISSSFYQMGWFVASIAIASYSGTLFTLFTRSTDPNTVTIFWSILVFCAAIVGGLNTLEGSVLGGMTFMLPRILEVVFKMETSFFSSNLIQFLYGIVLIVAIILRPQGVMGDSRIVFASPISSE